MFETPNLGHERQAELTDFFLHQFPEGLVGVDEEERVRLLNREAERVFGYDSWELEGKPLTRLFPSFFSATNHSELHATVARLAERTAREAVPLATGTERGRRLPARGGPALPPG
ncbi:PAS domain-containing protein [Thiohalorhabdus sp. Cl-TMA]|uniref:PAS domain-containing protein n=1 Tax=Thiohalorhabdus methylotrophus TaxID=3242694 RepID=A0ABV4TRD9_9GAMM